MRPTRHVPSRDRETPGGGGLSNLVAQGLLSPPARRHCLRASGAGGSIGFVAADKHSRFVIVPARGSASSNAPATTRPRSGRAEVLEVVRDTAPTPTLRPRSRAAPSIFQSSQRYRRSNATLAWPRTCSAFRPAHADHARRGFSQRRSQCLGVSYRFRAQEAFGWLSRLAITATTMSARKNSPPPKLVTIACVPFNRETRRP